MKRILGRAARGRGWFVVGGPWGGGGRDSGESGDDSGGGKRPDNPWSQPPGGGREPRRTGPVGPSMVDQISDRLRGIFGGGRGGGGADHPQRRPVWPYLILAFAGIWAIFTSMHRVSAEEAGVVTRFGRYINTIGPGVNFTLPAPIDRVQKVDIQGIREIGVGTGANQQNFVLTQDGNLIDLGYTIRWRVKTGEVQNFVFEMADPEKTIREVGESAMRAVVAEFTFDQAFGPARDEIAQRVMTMMQKILDEYRAGVEINGVAISQADPPAEVNDAFKEVSAKKQEAISNLNIARTYAQQVIAKAEGEAAQFNKVYEQYKLSPEVTRRRMYYETMERVLSKVDKTVVEARGVTPYLPLPQLQRTQPAPEGGAK